MEANNGLGLVAPFVLKTYLMVDDPSTDSCIVWGKANNSFVVIDPIDFSRKILPAYFKHDNFSSFVRQLNTYGFRKVDPDLWEFASESFLRGQKQLLNNIIRKKTNRSSCSCTAQTKQEDGMMEEEEGAILSEISRLKQEQKALNDELQEMNERLQATERRPKQVMSFLLKVVEDPNLIPGIMLQKDSSTRRLGDKKRRVMNIESSPSPSRAASISPTTTTTTTSSTAEEEEVSLSGTLATGSLNFPVTTTTWSQPIDLVSDLGNSMTLFPDLGGGLGLGGGGVEVNDIQTTPYPFSLLGGRSSCSLGFWPF
ncbi:hypothetical protein NE237_028084 [Protea cynaroides]|uniref:HSF-type DNA-binding domain-containing protein n=1 Tax=Protea cynaroides TaxID=273540 RepID=A0A9Q0GSK3_9MAGN|nr:hypothetical protein NE237_028084 [Protea cynaroides]